jgi:hypothetical protein
MKKLGYDANCFGITGGVLEQHETVRPMLHQVLRFLQGVGVFEFGCERLLFRSRMSRIRKKSSS